ncbi:MAG: radical SAM protein [Candidatus Omnitrophota bacterium]
MVRRYKHIYGPVFSWRLGRSLGVDPVYTGKHKVCSFDCVYCQAGRTHSVADKRRVFISTKAIMAEIKRLPDLGVDYFTLSGNGEPTLAKNLGSIISGIRKIRSEKIAVITNSSLMERSDVRRDLARADLVMAKLDADSKDLFARINRPAASVRFSGVIKGLKTFSSGHKKRLALQVMFTRDNKRLAKEIARIASGVDPAEIEINTPLREGPVKPLSEREIGRIKEIFVEAVGQKNIKIVNVYDVKKRSIKPMSRTDLLKRRGVR